MNREEKISKIKEMLHKNIPTIEKIIKRKEHESITLCLVIGKKVIGVDIQNSFIDNKTIQEIESHFSGRHIYHSILSDHEPKMCDHDGVFTYINDPSCRDMM
jgi:hypothetical protein